MGLSETIRQQLIETFRTEQAEHIQKISQGLLTLEKNPGATEQANLLKEIFREAHSLKGSARSVGMTTIENIGHGLEDILLQVKDKGRGLTPELFDLLYRSLDAVELVLQNIDDGKPTMPAKVLSLLAALEAATMTPLDSDSPAAPAPAEIETQPEAPLPDLPATPASEPPAASTPPKPPETTPLPVVESDTPATPPPTFHDETIRVSVSKLDTLMAQFSELLGTKIRIEQRLAELHSLQEFATQWQKEWAGLRNHYNRLTRNQGQQNDKDLKVILSFSGQSQDRLHHLNTQSNTLYRQLSNDAMRLSLVINELQEEIKRVRMLPLTTITTTFERMVRDLARQQGKLIRLTIEGGDTEMDKRVLEQIKDPLIHLLRNAVDHGLGTPEERRQAGKPIEGQIILKASQQGHNVSLVVQDDGKGLNLEAIREAAIYHKLISRQEGNKLSLPELTNLIFQAGLSTSQIITDISGRGVGLDVVHQNVADLHGTLNVDFEVNIGTSFTITLPLTLASSRGLLVSVGQQLFSLPFSTVERIVEINRNEIGHVEGREVITYQGQAIGVAWVEDLLELPLSSRQVDKLTVVVVGVAEKRLGLVVDNLEGEQEIVMKSLGNQLVKVPGIAGATVLGSGEVVLVLHTADLVKLATRTHTRNGQTRAANHLPHQTHKRILVVDDSITTRTLEKNILEAAGYDVVLATNGQEALSVLVTEGLPNLVVSDINMPYLDGFDLTYQIKHDARYAEVPVVLVTSLDSSADKARGIEVGADAYIVKSQFDQSNLLETIEQLV